MKILTVLLAFFGADRLSFFCGLLLPLFLFVLSSAYAEVTTSDQYPYQESTDNESEIGLLEGSDDFHASLGLDDDTNEKFSKMLANRLKEDGNSYPDSLLRAYFDAGRHASKVLFDFDVTQTLSPNVIAQIQDSASSVYFKNLDKENEEEAPLLTTQARSVMLGSSFSQSLGSAGLLSYGAFGGVGHIDFSAKKVAQGNTTEPATKKVAAKSDGFSVGAFAFYQADQATNLRLSLAAQVRYDLVTHLLTRYRVHHKKTDGSFSSFSKTFFGYIEKTPRGKFDLSYGIKQVKVANHIFIITPSISVAIHGYQFPGADKRIFEVDKTASLKVSTLLLEERLKPFIALGASHTVKPDGDYFHEKAFSEKRSDWLAAGIDLAATESVAFHLQVTQDLRVKSLKLAIYGDDVEGFDADLSLAYGFLLS